MSSPSNKLQPGPNTESLPRSTARSTSVAEAKANLPALLREVDQKRIEITVLRRNLLPARILPIDNVSAPEPADRILVASARVERLRLVTFDKSILNFARDFNLPVLSA